MLEIGKPQVRMNEGQSSSAKLEAPRTTTQSQERPNEIILDTPVEQKLQRNDPTKEDEKVIDTTLRVGAMESESTENPKAPPFTVTSKPFPNNTKLDNANRTTEQQRNNSLRGAGEGTLSIHKDAVWFMQRRSVVPTLYG